MKRLPSTGVPFVIRLLKTAADLLGRSWTSITRRRHSGSSVARTIINELRVAQRGDAYFFPSNAGRS
jgi:hypothetical protein